MNEQSHNKLLFAAVVTIGVFVMAARPVTDPDFWWHLRTGQMIVQQQAIFHADPYSFTRFGQPWINHEWLSDVLIFGLYRIGGFAALALGFALTMAAIFLTAFLSCGGSGSVCASLTIWAALASMPLWGARPQMFSLLFISLFLLILERSEVRPKLLWWMPPLMLLWVNLHAGYIAGIGLLLIFAVGETFDSAFGDSLWTQSKLRVRGLLLTLLACLVVVPFNPYGFKMYSYPFATLFSQAMQAHIAEWFSPDFHQPQYWPGLLLILFGLLVVTQTPRKFRSYSLILLLGTIYLGLQAQRHLALFALVAAPTLSRTVDQWLWREKEIAHAERLTIPTRTRLNASILLALAIFALFRVRHVIATQRQAEATRFPAAAVSFLLTHHPPAPIFNDYDWGGYFIWKLYPDYRVYIDGRADLYGPALMEQFSAADHLTDDWKKGLQSWRIRTVVLPPKTPLITGLQLEGGWRTVYVDSQAVILSRSPPRPDSKSLSP